jgi:DnaJ-class molecular chaperone
VARSVEVAALVGKTLVSVDGMAAESGRVVLVTADGAQYVTPGARECPDCGGSGYGPDRCDGPGDVSQDKCDRCGGRGLEPEASHA